LPTDCLELSTRFNNYAGKIDLKVGSGNIGLKQVYLIQPEEARFDHYVAKTAVVCETTLQTHSTGPETCVLTFRSLLRVRSMLSIPIQVIIRRDGHSSSLMCYDNSYEIEPHALWDVPIPFLEMEDCFLIVLIRDGHHIEERGPFPMGNIFGVGDEPRKDVKLRNLQKQLIEKGIRLTKTEIGSSLVCKTDGQGGSRDLRRTEGAVDVVVEDEKGFVKRPEPLRRLFEFVLDILPLFTLSNALPIPVTFEILQVGDNDVTEVEEEHARKEFGASHNGRNRPTIASRQSKSILPGDECHIVGLNLNVSCSIVFVLETLPGEQNLVSEPTVFPLERHKNWVKDFDKDDKTVTFNYWDPLYDGHKKFHHVFDDGNGLSYAHFSNPTPILMGSIQCRRQLVECGFKVSIFSPVWVINKSGLPLLYKYHAPLLKKALKTNKISQNRRESRQQRFYRHHSECFQSPKHDEQGTGLSVAEKEERVLHTDVLLRASYSSEDILAMKLSTPPIASMKSSLSSASPFGSRRRGDSVPVPRSSEDVLFSHEMWAKRFGANAPILLPSQDGKLQLGVYTPDASYTSPGRCSTGDTPSRFATSSGEKPSNGSSGQSTQFMHSFGGDQKDDLQTQLNSFQYFSKVSANNNRQSRDVAKENKMSWSKECSLDDGSFMNEYKDCFCDDAFVASSSLSSLPGCLQFQYMRLFRKTFFPIRYILPNCFLLSANIKAFSGETDYQSPFQRSPNLSLQTTLLCHQTAEQLECRMMFLHLSVAALFIPKTKKFFLKSIPYCFHRHRGDPGR
jgi:hypothetical protein